MCPAGYTTAYKGVWDQAGAGACTCPNSMCAITQQPSCTTGTVQLLYGDMGMCTQVFTIPGQGCFGLTGFGSVQQLSPLPLTPGQCSGQPKADQGMVMQTQVQTCTVPDSSYAAVCAGNVVPGMFQACLFAPGDVPCPSGSPFSKRTVIADSVTLSCSACTSCTVGGMCQNPELDTYSDGSCGNNKMIQAIPADGRCDAANQASQVASVQYSATVAGVTCTASGTTAQLQATNPQTICCR
jgi:hypothetical protein